MVVWACMCQFASENRGNFQKMFIFPFNQTRSKIFILKIKIHATKMSFISTSKRSLEGG